MKYVVLLALGLGLAGAVWFAIRQVEKPREMVAPRVIADKPREVVASRVPADKPEETVAPRVMTADEAEEAALDYGRRKGAENYSECYDWTAPRSEMTYDKDTNRWLVKLVGRPKKEQPSGLKEPPRGYHILAGEVEAPVAVESDGGVSLAGSRVRW